MSNHISKNQSGQTLLEVIIALGIITSVLFAVWALFLSNYNTERETETRIVAANLAREGIEAVKNLRDSNWIKINENVTTTGSTLWSWYQNTSSSVIDFNTGVVANLFGQDIYISSTPNQDSPLNKLYLNADGFFDHNSSGTPTAYSRVLMFNAICCQDTTPVDDRCDDYSISTSTISTVCSGGPAKIMIGISVVSKVMWNVAGKPRTIMVQDQLFNWR